MASGRRRLKFDLLAGLVSIGAIGGGLAPASIVRAQESTGAQVLAALEDGLSSAIAKAEKSVVAIARVRRDAQQGRRDPPFEPFGQAWRRQNDPGPGDLDFIPNDFATGVVIDAAGLILTNYHVLGEESDYYVSTADRMVYPARVKAADPRSDLAVLEIQARQLVAIRFGDAATLSKGRIVVALGNPYSIARDGQVSASWGIVSNLARKLDPNIDPDVPRGRSSLHQFGSLIQTDARLNLGASGGALVNLKGEMVGLTTSIAAVKGYEQAAGFAIPIDETFLRVIETLKLGREVEYGFLGITPRDPSPEQLLTGKRGGMIDYVFSGTPADKAGLQQTDLITHVNGRQVYDADSLMLEVGKLPAEASVRLTIERRDGKVDSRSVSLAKFRVLGKKIFTTPAPTGAGLRIDHWTAQFDPQRSRPVEIDLDGCVVVNEVDKDSQAWIDGVRPEMLITHVGSARVTSPREFHAAIKGKNGPVTLRLITPKGDRSERTTLVVRASAS